MKTISFLTLVLLIYEITVELNAGWKFILYKHKFLIRDMWERF